MKTTNPASRSLPLITCHYSLITIRLVALACVVLSPAPKAFGVTPASTINVIYSFAGDEDGEYTDTDLVIDSAGNLYGTSVLGGDFGSGTVFQLTPSGEGW